MFIHLYNRGLCFDTFYRTHFSLYKGDRHNTQPRAHGGQRHVHGSSMWGCFLEGYAHSPSFYIHSTLILVVQHVSTRPFSGELVYFRFTLFVMIQNSRWDDPRDLGTVFFLVLSDGPELGGRESSPPGSSIRQGIVLR